jgi:two-component system cell cycle response regulator
MLTDELRSRTSGDPLRLLQSELAEADKAPANILVVDNGATLGDRIRSALAGLHKVSVAQTPQEALEAFGGPPVELVIINLDMEGVDALRVCSQLKSVEQTRQTPILIIVDPEDRPRLLRALDLGVNDYLMRPVDRQELLARVSTQIRRYRYTERLRTSVRASMEMAITDALTGLYNRRYLETHLAEVITHAVNRGRLVSVLTLDVDFFKSVNDTYGHDAGDRVLQEMAGRLRAIIRNSDLACRTGGEEFVVVLPGTDLHSAERVGERVRKMVAAKPFLAAPGCHLTVTISLGVASLLNVEDTPEELLKRADRALYRAKREGRNRVSLSAA